MKKNQLWMLAAICICGLTMTSCFEDSPIEPAMRVTIRSILTSLPSMTPA